jgi:hypothetical protein
MSDGFDSSAAREAAEKARLYATHKARGSLGTFYQLYPENIPLEYQCPPPRRCDDGGREC